MDIALYIEYLRELVVSWPLIISVIMVSIIATIATRFIQIRYFFHSWKYALGGESAETKADSADMSTMQAFLNALSSSLGNGSIAGIAVAIYTGGPGAGIWILIIGFLLMAVRFCEVYLSTRGSKEKSAMGLGGPMLYLQELSGGSIIAYIYALSTVFFGLAGGNAAQTNSIRVSLSQTLQCSSTSFVVMVAVVLMFFVFYVVYGGAKRIVRISDFIVPIKVVVFFSAASVVLMYHHQHIIAALKLMIEYAFGFHACMGGLIGFTLQQAMRAGMNGVIFATEAGLGTAPILYGGAASKTPVKDGIASMLSTFISTIVCFLIALMIVASGVWNSGLSSTALTVQAFNTVFGIWGGWLVTFLSISFGMGVLVTYAYITRAAWLYVTGGRGQTLFVFCYAVAAFMGALAQVKLLWYVLDIVNAIMLVINLTGVMLLLPYIQRAIKQFTQ